ncbi:hypothetical protein [Streptomyces sp. NPDC049813]|uniref:DUF7927 domain-containing protein n=1 Tax=Streptomyces sp. NPDC049813 TaxID=3365597 RepID=UPI00379650F5
MWLRHLRGPAVLAAVTTAVASLLATAPPASAVVVQPFAKRYEEALYGDFLTLGNTVLRCPSAPRSAAARCAGAQAGRTSENNNQFAMEYADTAGLGTAVLNSSTGRVTVPPGATVAHARLFWGGNDGTYKLGRNQIARCDTAGPATAPPGSPLTRRPLVSVGGAAASRVAVRDAVRTPAGVGGPHYYTAESDVTSLFSGVATGVEVPVSVGDVWAPTGKGCVGGWSLTVVYKYPGPDSTYAPTRRNVYVYGGHVVQQSKDPDTTIPIDDFYRAGGGDVRASVTAYEGDANVAGDQFLVNGHRIGDPDGGGTGNFFDSHADGALDPDDHNNFSIDAKAAVIPSAALPPGATSAALTFRTKGDTYLPSALAFSVPVPDLEVTKTAAPKKVAPGGKVTYTITAKNIGEVDYPGARLSDDLSDVLDDADYDGDARATLGRVSYQRPRLTWRGDVPAGAAAKITYSVTLHDPLRGDGRLTNHVTADTPRTNCAAGAPDPNCGTAPVIQKRRDPRPPVPSPTSTRRPATTPPSPSPCATATGAGADGPCPAAGAPQHHPSGPAPAHHAHGSELADTGSDESPLLLYGGFAVSLCGLGALALAAVRSRRG